MTFDLLAQINAVQLKHFYDRYPEWSDSYDKEWPTHLLLDAVFDKLKSQDKEPVYPAETKSKYWKMSLKNVITYHKSWVAQAKSKNEIMSKVAKDQISDLKVKYFKTYLVRHYLLDKLKEEIKVFVTDDNTGKPVKILTFVGK